MTPLKIWTTTINITDRVLSNLVGKLILRWITPSWLVNLQHWERSSELCVANHERRCGEQLFAIHMEHNNVILFFLGITECILCRFTLNKLRPRVSRENLILLRNSRSRWTFLKTFDKFDSFCLVPPNALTTWYHYHPSITTPKAIAKVSD
jgi:hypothetical protein